MTRAAAKNSCGSKSQCCNADWRGGGGFHAPCVNISLTAHIQDISESDEHTPGPLGNLGAASYIHPWKRGPAKRPPDREALLVNGPGSNPFSCISC